MPRQTLVLPNGDILVAEGKGGGATTLRTNDYIAGILKSKGNTAVKGGNLSVAIQDALVRFAYVVGQPRAAEAPVTVAKLPSAINHHWTKSLAADADGRFLDVGIGSSSDIGERGMAVEENRAVVWQVDARSGATRSLAAGLRNPTALAVEPSSIACDGEAGSQGLGADGRTLPGPGEAWRRCSPTTPVMRRTGAVGVDIMPRRPFASITRSAALGCRHVGPLSGTRVSTGS